MSIRESLQAMEALWDSFTYELVGIDPPQWHENVLRERKNMIDNGTAEFISLEELKSNKL